MRLINSKPIHLFKNYTNHHIGLGFIGYTNYYIGLGFICYINHHVGLGFTIIGYMS